MVLVFSMMARTGLLGGEIRHSEINSQAPSNQGENEQGGDD